MLPTSNNNTSSSSSSQTTGSTTNSNNNQNPSGSPSISSLPVRHINNGFGGLPIRNHGTSMTSGSTGQSNNLMQSTGGQSTAAVPQYQQYFTLLQSMASNNNSSSSSSSPALSNLPSTSSIMAMHGIPSSSNSSVLRKTSFSAILAGSTPPKSVNLQTLSNQIATPQSTIQTKKNNSPPSSTSTSNNFNVQMSPSLGVISTQSAQNTSEMVASGSIPSNLLDTIPNSVSHNVEQDSTIGNSVKQIENMRPVPIIINVESASASPAVSTPKQRKPRKKKGEETPSSTPPPNSTSNDPSSPSGTGDDDSSLTPNTEKSSKGRSKTCKRWTEEQNRLLKEAVIKYGPRNWKKIAAEICGGIFTADQCNQHWHRVLHPRIIKGEWTPEEDNLLIEKVEEFGESSWTKVAEFLAGRTDIQCRHRYFQKKKENDTGRRKSVTSISSSPFMGGSVSSPSLGQSSVSAYDLSPMLGSSTNTESTQAILNNALMSGVNFPSPSLGISPSSILSGAATNTSNFVHHHRVPLFSAPSNVSLQERLKGDSVVLGSNTPTMGSSLPFIASSGTNEIPPFPESRKKQNQYYYVEKNGIDESDFTPPLASSSSSPILASSNSSLDILPTVEKKESGKSINENLLLCDEEDLSTPTIEKDLDLIKKKPSNTPLMTKNSSNMMTDEDDDMDEDEEEAQLTIDEMDTDKTSVASKVSLNSQQQQHSLASTPDIIKKEIPESPQLMNSPAIVGASPSVVNEKPKKRSSALNRMRANINVWVPFSESEEIVLRREISKQLKQNVDPSNAPTSTDPNAPKPIQVISFTNEDFLDRIDFVTILRENTTSFHPLRTPISLKVHSQALRQQLGDTVLTDENFKGETPRSLYEKVNSHSWLASSKNARISNTGSGSVEAKPRRRKNLDINSGEHGPQNGSSSTGKPPVPGRKRKQNTPISNSPAMALPSNGDSSGVVTPEPSQKKTKVEETPQAANSTFLILLLGKGAPKETRQIQPSKMCLPIETTLSELVTKIREELSLDYDPQLICDFIPVNNYSQTLHELMEANDIKINELLLQYK